MEEWVATPLDHSLILDYRVLRDDQSTLAFTEGSVTARFGVRDFEIQWISGFLDFKVDFWISKWISGFQSGFLDFKVDFWISKWISGFQSGFLDFKRISGFQSGFLDFAISEDTAKIYS